jgi:hypothetical protein
MKSSELRRLIREEIEFAHATKQLSLREGQLSGVFKGVLSGILRSLSGISNTVTKSFKKGADAGADAQKMLDDDPKKKKSGAEAKDDVDPNIEKTLVVMNSQVTELVGETGVKFDDQLATIAKQIDDSKPGKGTVNQVTLEKCIDMVAEESDGVLAGIADDLNKRCQAEGLTPGLAMSAVVAGMIRAVSGKA